MRKLERFFVLLYDRTSVERRVNEARKQFFAEGKSIGSIPPTQTALIQQTRKAAYQGGHCWGQAIVPVMNLPCPSQWEWMTPDVGWKPLWTTLPDVSSSCP